MPEYLALVHYRNATPEGGEDTEPPSTDDMNAAFARMERAGIGKVLH